MKHGTRRKILFGTTVVVSMLIMASAIYFREGLVPMLSDVEPVNFDARRVPGCYLAGLGENVDGQTVTFRATAYYHPSYDQIFSLPIFGDSGCPDGRYERYSPTVIAVVSPDAEALLVELKKPRTNADSWAKEARRVGVEKDIEVTGAAELRTNSWGSKYYLVTPEKIEPISSIRPFVPKGGG